MISTLDNLTTGRYVVTTCNGTRHLVDLDAQTSIRHGAPGREWSDKLFVVHPNAAVSGIQPKFAGHFEPVTPDGEEFHFITITGATVGQSMLLVNDQEWRSTSEIVSIEQEAS